MLLCTKKHNHLRGKVLKKHLKKHYSIFFANLITRCYYDMKRHNQAFGEAKSKKTLYNILHAT